MMGPRSETTLPGTDPLGSMARRLASERPAGATSDPDCGAGSLGESIMPPSAGPDHDQRLKVLLKEFFEAFFRCFFPAWADRFEFHDIDWLGKELFLAPPQGEKRQLDLVARVKLRPGAPPPRAGITDLVALVHVELESRASTP